MPIAAVKLPLIGPAKASRSNSPTVSTPWKIEFQEGECVHGEVSGVNSRHGEFSDLRVFALQRWC
jgi:hypothetical protein